MAATGWRRAKDIFQAALTRSPESRAAFLAEACADDGELRQDVEQLLAAHDDASEFLSRPATPDTGSVEAGEFAEPRRIGPYRILERIGRGGMGTVYRAVRDDAAFQKTVALKLVQEGRRSEHVERRFRQERQILARLQHPNIATVLDGGTTEDGQLFLVMELVAGRPITEYCAAQDLGTRERLTLFRSVCGAVHYAHQNLVVHRDIKPANVLVDTQGIPKLLDFGIAKLLASGVDPDVAATATMLPMMTPEYASPEQVKGQAVTTASDVYSLGVLLYELLAGRRPYDVNTDSMEAIVQAVCGTEPRMPSEVGGDKTPASPRVKGIPTASELRGDLDTIVLKALRKEPERRYPSAHELAEDVRRHLEGLPVTARADTIGYRAGKFVRRHRTAAVAAVVVAASLVGGIVTTIRQARIAEANHERAERRFNDVRKLANSFLFDVHDEIRELPGSTQVRRRLVATAQEYLDSLAREAQADTGLQRELAAAYERLGKVQGNQFAANLGDTAGALASCSKALEIRRALLAANPDDLELKRELADTLMGFAEIEFGQMNVPMTAARLREAVALHEGLVATSTDDRTRRRDLAQTLDRLAFVLSFAGDLKAEGEAGRKALALRESLAADDPSAESARQDLARSHNWLGAFLIKTGDKGGAVNAHRRAIALWEPLVADAPRNTAHRHELSNSYLMLGIDLSDAGDLAGADAEFRRALASMKSIVAEDPHNAQARWQQGLDHNALAYTLIRQGRPREALLEVKASLEIFERLSQTDPANAGYLYGVANTLQSTGEAYIKLARDPRASAPEQMSRWRTARSHYERSAAIYERMREEGTLAPAYIPDTDDVKRALAQCQAALGPTTPGASR